MIKKYEEPGLNSHPHLEEKNYCQKSRPKVLFKKKNEPTLVQINVEFL